MPNTSGGGRNALLEDIQKGRKLKKAVTNDRSAPIIATATGGGNASSHRRGRSSSTSGIGGSNNQPVGLGGLFAGGVPTLKSRSGGVDTGRGSNGLAIPPPLGRPRATSANPTDRSPTSSTKTPALPPRGANQNSSSKATGKSLNSSGPPALPNRSTPSVPSSTAPTPPARNNPPPSLPPRLTKPAPPPASKKPAANSIKKTTTSQSPSPQPRQVLSVIDKQRPLTAVLPTNGTKTLPVKRSLSPSKNSGSQSTVFTPQEPTTEGRWTFHPSSEFPKPRPAPNTEKVYPSGASTGSSIPLDLSLPQRAPPPPPLGNRTNGRK